MCIYNCGMSMNGFDINGKTWYGNKNNGHPTGDCPNYTGELCVKKCNIIGCDLELTKWKLINGFPTKYYGNDNSGHQYGKCPHYGSSTINGLLNGPTLNGSPTLNGKSKSYSTIAISDIGEDFDIYSVIDISKSQRLYPPIPLNIIVPLTTPVASDISSDECDHQLREFDSEMLYNFNEGLNITKLQKLDSFRELSIVSFSEKISIGQFSLCMETDDIEHSSSVNSIQGMETELPSSTYKRINIAIRILEDNDVTPEMIKNARMLLIAIHDSLH